MPQQRIHNIIAEIFWNPLRLPFTKHTAEVSVPQINESSDEEEEKPKATSVQPFPPVQRMPRLLKLEEDMLPTKEAESNTTYDVPKDGNEKVADVTPTVPDSENNTDKYETRDDSQTKDDLPIHEEDERPSDHFDESENHPLSEQSWATHPSLKPLAFHLRQEVPATWRISGNV